MAVNDTQGQNSLQMIGLRVTQNIPEKFFGGAAVEGLPQPALYPAATKPQRVGHQVHVGHDHGTVAENKDEKTLNILLVHWVNHNQSHEEGFQEWVEKAKAMGKTETAECIEKAIEYMNKANEMLVEAKKNM